MKVRIEIELNENDPNVPNDLSTLYTMLRKHAKVHIQLYTHGHTWKWSDPMPAYFKNVKVKVVRQREKPARPKIRNSSIFRFPKKVH